MSQNLRFASLTVFCSAILTGSAQTGSPFFVLPASTASAVAHPCSRGGPPAGKGWTPSPGDIAEAENHLAQIGSLKTGRESVPHPEQSLREYVGIVVSGRRLLYLNAIPQDQQDVFAHDRQTHALTNVCGGGTGYWGAVFDPAREQFSHLEINGEI